MIATIATRATTAAAPPAKGAPTLAGADFALSIAGLVGAGGDAPADPALALADPALAVATSGDPADDRHADAEGGTTLPGATPTLDPALAWLPFAPVEALADTNALTHAPTTIPHAPVAIATRATVPAATPFNPAQPAADIDLPDDAAPDAPVASTAQLVPPPIATPLLPVQPAAVQPTPTQPAPTQSTTISAIATSSLTPIPLVAPRIDNDDATTTPIATATPTPIDIGAIAPVAVPTAKTADSAAAQRPLDSTSILAPLADTEPATPQTADRSAAPVADVFATIAAAVTPATSRATTPIPVATPARFQMAATAAVDMPVPTSLATSATPPADRAPVTTAAPAQPVVTAPPPIVPTTASVAPPLLTGFAATQPDPLATALAPATTDAPVIAAAAPVPVAPASFLRQVAADTPVTPLAVPAPAAPSAPGIVFGAAIRAAAATSDDKPALIATDPLAPVATPVAELRTVTAAADAQQAPLDMSQGRWPHAMIDRIEQLRDAANAVDTRIRLVPDALGQIDVSIRQDGGTTHVSFAAEQAATRTMLQDAAPRLAAIAEERGLKLGQSITDASAQQHQQSSQRQAAQQSAANRAPLSTSTDRDSVTDAGDDRLA